MSSTDQVWPLSPSIAEGLFRELAVAGESRSRIRNACRHHAFLLTPNRLRRLLAVMEASARGPHAPRDGAEQALCLLWGLDGSLSAITAPGHGEAAADQLAALRAAAAALTERAARLSVELSDVRPAEPAAPVAGWVVPS